MKDQQHHSDTYQPQCSSGTIHQMKITPRPQTHNYEPLANNVPHIIQPSTEILHSKTTIPSPFVPHISQDPYDPVLVFHNGTYIKEPQEPLPLPYHITDNQMEMKEFEALQERTNLIEQEYKQYEKIKQKQYEQLEEQQVNHQQINMNTVSIPPPITVPLTVDISAPSTKSTSGPNTTRLIKIVEPEPFTTIIAPDISILPHICAFELSCLRVSSYTKVCAYFQSIWPIIFPSICILRIFVSHLLHHVYILYESGSIPVRTMEEMIKNRLLKEGHKYIQIRSIDEQTVLEHMNQCSDTNTFDQQHHELSNIIKIQMKNRKQTLNRFHSQLSENIDRRPSTVPHIPVHSSPPPSSTKFTFGSEYVQQLQLDKTLIDEPSIQIRRQAELIAKSMDKNAEKKKQKGQYKNTQ
jgi:hypothetical protein